MKHLLGLKDVSGPEIQEILDEAFRMKREVLQRSKKDSCLSGKSVITLFYENSTRTRLSFELASKYLGATAANIAASGSSVAKGETLIDTAKTIDQMAADVIIIRHSASGAPHLVAQYTRASVVNAGDGMHEHPTQALLDLMTIQEKKGGIKGLRVAIVGDVKHSRVARSNIYGLHKLGADVVLGGPSTLMPAEIEAMGVPVCYDVDRAVQGADVDGSAYSAGTAEKGAVSHSTGIPPVFRGGRAQTGAGGAGCHCDAPRPGEPRGGAFGGCD